MAENKTVGMEARIVVAPKAMQPKRMGADVSEEAPQGRLGRVIHAIGTVAKKTGQAAAVVLLAAAVGTGISACGGEGKDEILPIPDGGDTATDLDTDVDTDSDSDMDTDSDTDSDTDIDTDSDTDVDTDTDTDVDTDTDTDVDTDTDTDSDTDTDTDSDTDTATEEGDAGPDAAVDGGCEDTTLDADTFVLSVTVHDTKTADTYTEEVYADATTATTYLADGHPDSGPYTVSYAFLPGLPEYTDGATSTERSDRHHVYVEYKGEEWVVAKLGGSSLKVKLGKEVAAGVINIYDPSPDAGSPDQLDLPSGYSIRLTNVSGSGNATIDIVDPSDMVVTSGVILVPGNIVEVVIGAETRFVQLHQSTSGLSSSAELSVYSEVERLTDGQLTADGGYVSLSWELDTDGVQRLNSFTVSVPDCI